MYIKKFFKIVILVITITSLLILSAADNSKKLKIYLSDEINKNIISYHLFLYYILKDKLNNYLDYYYNTNIFNIFDSYINENKKELESIFNKYNFKIDKDTSFNNCHYTTLKYILNNKILEDFYLNNYIDFTFQKGNSINIINEVPNGPLTDIYKFSSYGMVAEDEIINYKAIIEEIKRLDSFNNLVLKILKLVNNSINSIYKKFNYKLELKNKFRVYFYFIDSKKFLNKNSWDSDDIIFGKNSVLLNYNKFFSNYPFTIIKMFDNYLTIQKNIFNKNKDRLKKLYKEKISKIFNNLGPNFKYYEDEVLNYEEFFKDFNILLSISLIKENFPNESMPLYCYFYNVHSLIKLEYDSFCKIIDSLNLNISNNKDYENALNNYINFLLSKEG